MNPKKQLNTNSPVDSNHGAHELVKDHDTIIEPGYLMDDEGNYHFVEHSAVIDSPAPQEVEEEDTKLRRELFKDVQATTKGKLVSTRANIVKYIDACIRLNRVQRDRLSDKDIEKAVLVGAIDALQSLRVSLTGKTLPLAE
jgi:hypothetical protein